MGEVFASSSHPQIIIKWDKFGQHFWEYIIFTPIHKHILNAETNAHRLHTALKTEGERWLYRGSPALFASARWGPAGKNCWLPSWLRREDQSWSCLVPELSVSAEVPLSNLGNTWGLLGRKNSCPFRYSWEIHGGVCWRERTHALSDKAVSCHYHLPKACPYLCIWQHLSPGLPLLYHPGFAGAYYRESGKQIGIW